MKKHHLVMGLSFLFATGLTACGGGGSNSALSLATSSSMQLPMAQSSSVRPPTATTPMPLPKSIGAAVPATLTEVLAINAGGKASGAWAADEYYSGGAVARQSTSAVNTSGVSNAAPQVVYQTRRHGRAFKYTVTNLKANTAYTVMLDMSEEYATGSGQRSMDIAINGTQVLNNLDIFAAAGGAHIAMSKQFTTKSDGNGTIVIQFNGIRGDACIGGIELFEGSNPTPAPSPSVSAYPIYSTAFKGNTPFHHTVAQLMQAGATVLSAQIAQNYWNEGIGNGRPANQSGGVGPLYTVVAGDPAYTFSCPTYGTCDANGMTAHFPAGAYAETGTDHHLSTFDPVYTHGEIDGWGGDGNPRHACNLNSGNPGTATCSWGGFYPFNGSGLATVQGDSGDAGGYAFGLMDISAQELLQGHIDHALGMEQSCLDNNGVYPSTIGRSSDATCPHNLEPNARYGDLIHIKSSVNVANLGYSKYCQVIVQALQTYGGYTADNNGSWGVSLNVEYMNTYSATDNPWYNTIFPSMVSGGDGNGSGSNFSFSDCLQRIPTSDIEVIQISPNLPPQ